MNCYVTKQQCLADVKGSKITESLKNFKYNIQKMIANHMLKFVFISHCVISLVQSVAYIPEGVLILDLIMRCLLCLSALFVIVVGDPGYKKWSNLEPSLSLGRLLEQQVIEGGVSSSVNVDLLADIISAWKFFKIHFKRVYDSIHEETRRFFIFGANFVKMVEHNHAYQEGKVTYKMGVNEFTDKVSQFCIIHTCRLTMNLRSCVDIKLLVVL